MTCSVSRGWPSHQTIRKVRTGGQATSGAFLVEP
jgi:hypothetical protein